MSNESVTAKCIPAYFPDEAQAKMPAKVRWLGLDLAPLPFESFVSILFRFSCCNGLSWADFLYEFRKGPNSSQVDAGAFAKASYGPVVSDRFRQAAFEEDGLWQRKQFRFCPICLEAFYHSWIFQCDLLVCCPVHSVPLQVSCQCCGAPTPSVSHGGMIFRRPYECNFCHLPVSGATQDLRAHLDLRSTELGLSQAIAPYECWWQETRAEREWIGLLSKTGCSAMQGRWCQVNEFKRSLVLGSNDRLRYLRGGYYRPQALTQIRWRYRMAPWTENREKEKRGNHRNRITEAIVIYRCVLRQLLRWLGSQLRLSKMDVQCVIENIPSSKVESTHPALLAFWLMRWQLEKEFSSPLGQFGWPVEIAHLPDRNGMPFGIWRQDAPRIAWKALFLALFSAWLEIARREQPVYVFDFARGVTDAMNLVFFRTQAKFLRGGEWFDEYRDNADEAWHEGVVAFLTIPGLLISAPRPQDNE